jgi:diacylglycerol kinase family enzyme
MTQRGHKAAPGGRNIAIIVNPRSAKGKWSRLPKLRGYIQSVFPGRVHDEAKDKAGTIDLARKLSLENDVLVALGGDGTMADVMQGVFEAGRQDSVALGLIPLGSGNAIRRSLRIPKQIRKAVRLIETGTPMPIDVIDAGGRIASLVSIGATAKTTHKKSQSKIPGLVGHILAARIMFTYPREEMDVDLFDGLDDRGRPFDEKRLKLKLYDCIVNKINYFGYNWTISPKARIDDGYLDVTFFDIRAYSYVFYFPLIYTGRYQKILQHFKVKRMLIRGKDLHIQYNGEILPIRDEIELKVLPKAVRIIAPR